MEALSEDDPRRVGPYEILGLLGQGGMGRVYLGRDDAGRQAAVKVIHADLARDPAFRLRFQREVATTRAVSGPYIAAVLDAGGEGAGSGGGERPWLATEYVPAPSLHTVVSENGPLRPDRVRTLGAELAEALAMIHDAGLVHRDVKPPNLLLAPAGLKLIDFGIARGDDDTTMTRTGMVLGTPTFMAPEQLRGRREDVGPRADVFAVGCVLVFAATGDYVFGRGDPDQLHYRIVHEEPQVEGVRHDLRPLILRCLAKDPAERPTAAELAALLNAEAMTHVAAPEGNRVGGGVGSVSDSGSGGAHGAGGQEIHSDGDAAPDTNHDPAEPPTTAGSSRSRRRWPVVVGIGAGVTTAVAVLIAALSEPSAGVALKGGASPGGAGSTPSAAGSASPGSSPSGGPTAGGPVPADQPSSPSGTSCGTCLPAPSGITVSQGSTTGNPQAGASQPGGAGHPTSPAAGPVTSVPAPSTHPSTTTRPAPSTAPPSATNVPPAAAPSSISATTSPPSDNYATANWSAVPGATSYNLKIITSFTNWYRTTSVAATTFSDSVYPGDRICFQVQAVNAFGTSPWSNQFCYQNG